MVSDAAYAKLRAQVAVTEPGAAYHPPVNMAGLAAINPDTVGWLRAADSVIDYPVVQGADNAYYLTIGFDGARSNSGCLFLDARNRGDFSDSNNLIYGHNMRNGSMFGTLKSFMDREYLDAHMPLELFGLEEGFVLKPFAIYTAGDTGEYLRCEFASDQEYQEWIGTVMAKSALEMSELPQPGERVVTLVSCVSSASQRRVVMHLVMKPGGSIIES